MLRSPQDRRVLWRVAIAAFAAVGPGPVCAQPIPTQDLTASLEESPFPPAAPEDVGLDAAKLTALADLATGWVEDDRIVGAELLIVKNRRTVLHRTVGWSDREARIPMHRRSLFRLRSMTKPFTGTAALMLVEEGKLALDAPVSRYLPSWDNERSGRITVEQLLTHHSGFEQGGWPAPAASYPNLRAVVDAAGEQGPQHPPGERFLYSDANSFTLGALVAQLSGMPIERFIETRILAPLGLDDTHIGVPPGSAWADRVHPTYVHDEDGRWTKYWMPADGDDVFPYFRASGGLLSTALDYARWLAAWMDGTRLESGGRLLSGETVTRALTSYRNDGGGGYGYQWEIEGSDPLVFGHGGSDGTLGLAVPAEDLIVIYFTQSRGSGTTDEWNEAVRALWGVSAPH
jgi:CubicO group peptidase (beta-lactamase class C family)